MYSNEVENVYGSKKRLAWIKSIIDKSQSIIDLGCGTGCMITLPLVQCGYNIVGIDIHEESIECGRVLLRKSGLQINNIKCCKLPDLAEPVDVIIASEVLEHLKFDEIKSILLEVKRKLRKGGIFLVTVPNGYGCFEIENYMWKNWGIASLVDRYKIDLRLANVKIQYFGVVLDSNDPSTLNPSPHIQSFTLRSIKNLLVENGFEIISTTGTVLFCGPLSHILFRGIKPLLRLNCYLGSIFSPMAAGYMLHCRKMND